MNTLTNKQSSSQELSASNGSLNGSVQGTEQQESAYLTTKSGFWHKWFGTLKNVLPIYVGVHMGVLVTNLLATLFIINDFDPSPRPLRTLLTMWKRWDTGHFIAIAQSGYDEPWRTAFFPLHPLLMRLVSFVIHSPLVAALLISNVASLVISIVLYQLVKEDFDEHRAFYTVLYLSIFPTAFFLYSGYNEALFICMCLLSFYNMRHGNWWLAGLFGFFASLTRSVGFLLLLPFFYEYLRQHQFRLKNFRLDIVSSVLFVAGIATFAVYCNIRFHDYLAFSHAQDHWNRHFHGPWHGIIGSVKAISMSGGLVSFQALRNLTDLVPNLLMIILMIMTVVGPWRFPRSLWAYSIFGGSLLFFLQLVPMEGTGIFPLQSMSRFMLEIFPAFIVLAGFGKNRMFNINYLMISGAVLFFLLTQFLGNHWVM